MAVILPTELFLTREEQISSKRYAAKNRVKYVYPALARYNCETDLMRFILNIGIANKMILASATGNSGNWLVKYRGRRGSVWGGSNDYTPIEMNCWIFFGIHYED